MIDLRCGDALEVLETLEDGSVQCCVTSPPYWGLRDYGVPGQLGLEPTPEAYIARMVEVFREVRRVLRDDGTLWLNLGDSYASSGGERSYGSSDNGTGRGPGTKRHDVPNSGLKPKDLIGIPWRVAFALQADGWYLRSDCIWHKPNPMPESVRDRPTKAHEYLFLLSKRERYYWDAEAVKEPHVEPRGFGGKDAKDQYHGAMSVGGTMLMLPVLALAYAHAGTVNPSPAATSARSGPSPLKPTRAPTLPLFRAGWSSRASRRARASAGAARGAGRRGGARWSGRRW